MMDPFTIAFLAYGLVNAGASIYQSYQQREEGKKQADYQETLNRNRIAAETYSRDTALGKLGAELAVDKQNAYTKASDIETSATTAFTGAMEKTYLGQLGAEADLLNVKAQGDQAVGSLEAGAAARGLRAPTITKDVLESNIRDQVNQTRKQIDSGRDLSVSQNQASLNMNLKNAADMRAQFNPGSAYMDLYGLTRDRIQGSSDIALAGLANQGSYLSDIRKSYDYENGWWIQDAFAVAGAALNTYSAGYSMKLWGQPSGSSPSGGGSGRLQLKPSTVY
jgi:hypothetical protein